MNILFITADQLRYDYLGYRNSVPVNTPNIDALAKKGAVHEHAYTVNPLCMPARCSLLTGLYSHQHGINNNCGDLNPLLPTLPQALHTKNYYNAMIGKIHFYEGIPGNLDYTLCRDEVQKLGFDYVWLTSGKSMSEYCDDDWTYHLKEIGVLEKYREDLVNRNNYFGTDSTFLKEEDTVDYVTAQKAIEFLEGYDRENPFFIWLSFCNPHFPYDPVDIYHNKYKGANLPPPIGCDSDRLEFWNRHAVAYTAMVEQLDNYIGSVIKKLEEKNIFDDTLIVFTADHGNMMGDHNLDSKNHPHNGSIRVPFIAVNKTLANPGTYDQAVEITDVVATFAQVAGIEDLQEYLPESPSQSLLDVWQGGRLQREYAFTENGYQFQSPFMTLCNGKWKYTFYPFTASEVLFDLVNDPGEMDNVSRKFPERTAEFRKLMLERIGTTPIPAPPFWVLEKITGKKSPNWHHGPQNKNIGLMCNKRVREEEHEQHKVQITV